MQPSRAEPAESRGPGGVLGGCVLLAALAVALTRQGGDFTAAQWSLGLLVGGALLVSLVDRPPSRADLRFLVVPVLVAMAGWELLDGSLHGTPPGAFRSALLPLRSRRGSPSAADSTTPVSASSCSE